jgi:hypothetical protein
LAALLRFALDNSRNPSCVGCAEVHKSIPTHQIL